MDRFDIATNKAVPESEPISEDKTIRLEESKSYLTVKFHFTEFDYVKNVAIGQPIDLRPDEPPTTNGGILKSIEIKGAYFKQNFTAINKCHGNTTTFEFEKPPQPNQPVQPPSALLNEENIRIVGIPSPGVYRGYQSPGIYS